MGTEDDKSGDSHLARQARKTARLINQEFSKSSDPGDLKEGVSAELISHGFPLTIVGDRGNGKSTWINFFRAALKGELVEEDAKRHHKTEWIDIFIDLVPLTVSAAARPQAVPFVLIAVRLKEKLGQIDQEQEQQEAILQNIRSLKEKRGSYWSEIDVGTWPNVKTQLDKWSDELEQEAYKISMAHELAGQAAIAFAADENDFAKIYSKLTIESGLALSGYTSVLGSLLKACNYRVLLTIDDLDMIADQKSIPGFAWGSLYLTEHAPVCRIIATAEKGLPLLVGGQSFIKQQPEQIEGWIRKVVGREVSLGGMNEIRKIQFLGRPKPEENAPYDGRMVWSEALSESQYDYNSGWQYSVADHERFIREMIWIDWQTRLKEEPAGLREYWNVLLDSDDQLRDVQMVAERKWYLYGILNLFPSNRRAAVDTTNILVGQREQTLSEELQFDRVITWHTFSARLFRCLMVIGYCRWRIDGLGKLLWQRPTELLSAIHSQAIVESGGEEPLRADVKPSYRVSFQIDNAPDVIAGDLEDLATTKPKPKLNAQQHMLLWLLVKSGKNIPKAIL